MTDPRWDRYAAAAGLGAAVLLAVLIVVAPLYPWYDDSPVQIVQYYSANASAIRVQVMLVGLAGVLFLSWLAGVRLLLRRTEGDAGLFAVVFASAIVAAAIAAFAAVATLAATHGLAPVPRAPLYGPGMPFRPDIASIPLHEVRLGAYTISLFPLAPMLAAFAVLAALGNVFPRWHTSASYALAVLLLGTGLSVLIDTGPFAPGGVYTLVLYGLFIVWLGVTSWLMMRPPQIRREPTDERSPAPDETERLSPGPLPSPPRDVDPAPGDAPE